MIRPLRDYVVVRKLGDQAGMIGLIHIPDTEKLANKTGTWAEVIAAGKDVRDAHVGRKVHVTVYGSHLAGVEIEEAGEKLSMLRERELNGILVE